MSLVCRQWPGLQRRPYLSLRSHSRSHDLLSYFYFWTFSSPLQTSTLYNVTFIRPEVLVATVIITHYNSTRLKTWANSTVYSSSNMLVKVEITKHNPAGWSPFLFFLAASRRVFWPEGELLPPPGELQCHNYIRHCRPT